MTNIICFGDSITRGENDYIYGGWVDRLKSESLKTFSSKKVSVYNLGISAENSRGIVKRFDNELESRIIIEGTSIATIAYGANDLVTIDGNRITPIDIYIENIRQCIVSAKQMDVKPVIINILPISSNLDGKTNNVGKRRTNGDIDLYNERLLKLTDELSVKLFDVNNAFKKNKENLLSEDGIHPNTDGHSVIFNYIKNQLNLMDIKI